MDHPHHPDRVEMLEQTREVVVVLHTMVPVRLVTVDQV
tara:strand:+ start:398 stop:511 length:114 start_codon:yes stop_codon:yes gene_type:complete